MCKLVGRVLLMFAKVHLGCDPSLYTIECGVAGQDKRLQQLDLGIALDCIRRIRSCKVGLLNRRCYEVIRYRHCSIARAKCRSLLRKGHLKLINHIQEGKDPKNSLKDDPFIDLCQSFFEINGRTLGDET